MGGTGAGPLRMDGGPAPRARGRRPRARPRRAVRPGDGPQPDHRAARLAERLRSAARRLQPRARLEPPGRPGAREGAAAGPPCLHRGIETAGRAGARGRPARVVPASGPRKEVKAALGGRTCFSPVAPHDLGSPRGRGRGGKRPRGRRAPGRPRRPSGQRPRGRGACRRWPRHRRLGRRAGTSFRASAGAGSRPAMGREPADAVLPAARPRAGAALRSLVFVRADGRPASVGEEAISHRGEPVARDLCGLRRGTCRGSRGRSPSSAPLYPQRVGWLGHLSVAQASLGGRLRNASAGNRPDQRPPGRCGQALRDLSADSQSIPDAWWLATLGLGSHVQSLARVRFAPARRLRFRGDARNEH